MILAMATKWMTLNGGPQTQEEERWYEIYRKAVSHLVEIGLFPEDSLEKTDRG